MRRGEQREEGTKAECSIDNGVYSKARARIVSLTIHGELQIGQARVSTL